MLGSNLCFKEQYNKIANVFYQHPPPPANPFVTKQQTFPSLFSYGRLTLRLHGYTIELYLSDVSMKQADAIAQV